MENDLINRNDLIKTINSVMAEFVIKGEIQSYEVYDTIIALIQVAPSVNEQRCADKHSQSCEMINKNAAVRMLREKADSYAAKMFDTLNDLSIARLVALECATEISNMNNEKEGEC